MEPSGASRSLSSPDLERPEDADALELARLPSQTVVISAPGQHGKSRLLRRYADECRNVGKRVALVDAKLLPLEVLASYPAFLTWLATEMLEKLALDASPRPEIRSQLAMTHFVEDRILRVAAASVTLAFDHLDGVLGQPYQSSFFSMLRAWHELRGDSAAWEKLDLALALRAPVSQLIQDAGASPFNVGVMLTPGGRR